MNFSTNNKCCRKILLCSFQDRYCKNCYRNSDIEVYLCILYNFRLNPNTEYSEHIKYIKLYKQATAQPKCQTICLF